ncbi:MAG: orotate phosphoribosyltransferase [bacterium]|nr:orotate phosphoribosyltransferase [bacterium]
MLEKEKARLLEILKCAVQYKKEKFRLSSGRESNFYVDGKLITLSSEGAYLTAKIILSLIKDKAIDAIGGLTMGADPIVGGIAALSFEEGNPISAFIVRKDLKKHGTMRLIEGPLKKGGRVAIVEDVVTTGESVLRAIKAVEEEGCRVEMVIALVDRSEEKKPELRNYPFVPIFTWEDLEL